MDLERLTRNVVEVAKQSGVFLREEVKRITKADIEVKGLNNFVTYVDKSSEKMIVEKLSVLLPGSGFIAEESTAYPAGDEFQWIIDPLDGTTNFIHGVPLYCVSIALRFQDEIILGVIAEPNLDECFYTWKGGKSYLNGKVIRVSERALLKDSLLATGFPYNDYHLLDMYMDMISHTMQHTHGIRRLGSAAVDIAYVAAGRYEGFFEYGLCPWDVAAGAIIVKNAGGKVTDFSGGENYLFGKELVATNMLIFNEFIEVLGNRFK
jgi:myo-inositol-1(or 4)-monophosphatase